MECELEGRHRVRLFAGLIDRGLPPLMLHFRRELRIVMDALDDSDIEAILRCARRNRVQSPDAYRATDS
jgi:hypothetical protein